MEDTTTTAITPTAVEDNSPTATPPVEPTTSSEPVVTAPVVPTVEPERPPRAERRIQQLSAQLREAQGQSYTPQQLQTPQAPNLSDLFAGKDSIDPDELNKAGQDLWQQAAQSSSGLSSLEVQALRNEIQQKEAINNYSRDETLLPTKFSELNPASDDYIELADEKIAKAYRDRAVRQTPNGQIWVDPSVKLADVAADYIDMVRAGAERGKARSTSNLAALADNGAITPNTEANHPAKSFNDMSLKEMEASLRSQGRDV